MSQLSAAFAGTTHKAEDIVIKAGELQALLQRMHEAESKAAALEDDLQRAVNDLNCIK